MHCRLHRARAEGEPNTADAPKGGPNTADAPNRIPPMQREAPGDARSADPEPQLSSPNFHPGMDGVLATI
jgi:hypothetical protein